MSNTEAMRAAAMEVLITIAEDSSESAADRVGAAHCLLMDTKLPDLPAVPALPDMRAVFAQMDEHFSSGDEA